MLKMKKFGIKIALISLNFKKYSSWNVDVEDMSVEDFKKLDSLVK